MKDNERTSRPVSTPHLVFGIVFTGIAAVKFIGAATNADLPRSAIGFPIVLIGAGIIGLIATLVNARRRSRTAYAALPSTDAPAASSSEDEPLTSTDTEATDQPQEQS